jgi:hypothetical protein
LIRPYDLDLNFTGVSGGPVSGCPFPYSGCGIDTR